jgi:hypothetical protein
MVLKYIEKSEQLDSGERTTLQALLVPEQALEIGDALKRSVQALEIGKSLKRSVMMLQAPSPEVEPAMNLAVSA